MDAKLLTVGEAAARLETTADAIRRWIRAGKLRATRPAGRRTGYRITEAELESYIKTRYVRVGWERRRDLSTLVQPVKALPLLGLWDIREAKHWTQAELDYHVGAQALSTATGALAFAEWHFRE